jgi:hypothetical protein
VHVTSKKWGQVKIFGRNWVCEKMEKYRNKGDGKAGDGVAVVRWWCRGGAVVGFGCFGVEAGGVVRKKWRRWWFRCMAHRGNEMGKGENDLKRGHVRLLNRVCSIAPRCV